MKPRRVIGAVLLVRLLAACVAREDPTVNGPPLPTSHMPLPPDAMVRLLESGDIEPLTATRAAGGVMGVARAIVRFPQIGANVEVKWKEAPAGGDGWNNTPRKEIAAYRIQRWFLDAADYLVPPAAVRCIPLEPYRRLFPEAQPNLPDAACVLGLVTAWLQAVEVPDELYHPERFERDPAYARVVADLNLLLHLIDQRDARQGNILVAAEPHPFRAFSVDNGIAFGGLVYNYFRPHWNVIRVPAVSRASVERLRKVDREELDALAVVAELRADAKGVYRPVPPTPPWARSRGVRLEPGRIQMGLTDVEIGGVAERIRELLARVDAQELQTL